jgi:hypothetical protein
MNLILLLYISNLNYIYKIFLSLTTISLIISYYNQQKEYNLKKMIIYYKDIAQPVFSIFNNSSLENKTMIKIKTNSYSTISLMFKCSQQKKLLIITCNNINIEQFKTLRRIAMYNK